MSNIKLSLVIIRNLGANVSEDLQWGLFYFNVLPTIGIISISWL